MTRESRIVIRGDYKHPKQLESSNILSECKTNDVIITFFYHAELFNGVTVEYLFTTFKFFHCKCQD